MEGGDVISRGYDQPGIAKKKKGSGPRTKRQVRILRAKQQQNKELDKVRFRSITKGTHI